MSMCVCIYTHNNNNNNTNQYVYIYVYIYIYVCARARPLGAALLPARPRSSSASVTGPPASRSNLADTAENRSNHII